MNLPDLLQSHHYHLSRLLIERALGLIYAIAFLNAINQFRPLLGEHGLLPVPSYLRRVSFRQAPSLFHLHYSDRAAAAVSWAGLVLALAVIAGLTDLAPLWLGLIAWFVLWALYQSIVNVGQIFYGFGWESLLLEAGFLAMFLGAGRSTQPVLVIYLFRWLLFRVEFGAGLIKLRGDPCWRDLTCLDYHHETQPMPNPMSWYAHRLPKLWHRIEVAGNHFTQLVVPFGLFLPQPVPDIAGGIILLTQCWLVVTGNFAWLNFLTLALSLSAFDDRLLGSLLPFARPAYEAPLPAWWLAFSLALTALVAGLSYWPVRNLVSRRQLMNFSFNPLHLVNTYGAFGSVTRDRLEVMVEGAPTRSHPEWREYEFKGKPGDVRRRPPQYAPYHLRLDWLMWFAAMESVIHHVWFLNFVVKLLEGDRPTLKLLRRNPFPDRPPAVIRARLYHYRFTTWSERRRSGAWWRRELIGDYLRPTSLD